MSNPTVHLYNDAQVRSLVRMSHKRQFAGEDYQAVLHDIADPARCDDAIQAQLESSPDPGCECAFCQSADWSLSGFEYDGPLGQP
jgi:hypothetical protein